MSSPVQPRHGAPGATNAPESLVLPGFEPPAGAAPTYPVVEDYFVRVRLTGVDGQTRRGTVAIAGDLLRDLAAALDGGREARSFIRDVVDRLCRQYPQDLSVGHARWKTMTGYALDELVRRAVLAELGRPVGDTQLDMEGEQ